MITDVVTVVYCRILTYESITLLHVIIAIFCSKNDQLFYDGMIKKVATGPQSVSFPIVAAKSYPFDGIFCYSTVFTKSNNDASIIFC